MEREPVTPLLCLVALTIISWAVMLWRQYKYKYDRRRTKRASMAQKYKDILKMKENAHKIALSEGQTFEIKKRGFLKR